MSFAIENNSNTNNSFNNSLNHIENHVQDKNNERYKDRQQKTQTIIFKLQQAFNYENQINKVESIHNCMNNQDVINVLIELSRKNMEDIAVFILTEFNITTSQATSKEELFKDFYLLAIKKGQCRILEALDKLDFNFSEIRDNEGNTGLILAVIYSNIQVAKFFLKKSPDMLDEKNSHGYNALTWSVYNNDNLMFFLLVNNLKAPITDGNPLCELAIRNENLEILSYWNPALNQSKCLYIPNEIWLHFAACQNDIHIFKMVCKMISKHDYQIPATLETALHWAVMRGSYHIIKAIVGMYKDEQIDIDSKNVFGVTPFFLANLRQDKFICELWYENGADANESDKEGNSIVHTIASLGDWKWLKYLCKKFNINVYLKNDKGDTPFILAIWNENLNIVEYLIDLFRSSKGTLSSNLNWRNKYGQTPLHAAVFTGNIKIIELLLKNKADIQIYDINELTPYHYAYIEEKENVVKTIHEILGVDKSAFIK